MNHLLLRNPQRSQKWRAVLSSPQRQWYRRLLPHQSRRRFRPLHRHRPLRASRLASALKEFLVAWEAWLTLIHAQGCTQGDALAAKRAEAAQKLAELHGCAFSAFAGLGILTLVTLCSSRGSIFRNHLLSGLEAPSEEGTEGEGSTRRCPRTGCVPLKL